MRYLLISAIITFSTFHVSAQTQIVTTPRVSPRAQITQTIGITDVTINYSRPAVRGREIWGTIVPYGMFDPGWGSASAAPWRVGADENTTISFSTDVTINEIEIAKGTYGMFMIIQEDDDVEIILSSDIDSWGNYFFDESEVVARIKTSLLEHDFTENLTFEFSDFTGNSSYVAMNWEHKSIPFEISVDLNKTVVEKLRRELRGKARFSYLGPLEAADWCVTHNTNLEEALEWATLAANMNPQFNTLKVKADALEALGKEKEAETVMNQAIPMASVMQLHGYGRQLIQNGDVDGAMDIFEANAKEHPNTWPVNYGLARGYSAKGEYEKAEVYLEKALKNCPDELNKVRVEENLEKLARKEDIN